MAKTSIDWADSVWNPVWGCKFNCSYCYARKLAKFGGQSMANRIVQATHNCIGEGAIEPCKELYDELWERFQNFEPTEIPQAWDKHFPPGSAVFVNSMSDVSAWDDDWLVKAVDFFENQDLQFVTLTKDYEFDYDQFYYFPNCYLGYTVTNNSDIQRLKEFQPRYSERYNGYNHKFINIEPLLEPLNQESIEYLATAPALIFGVETGSKQAQKNLKIHSAWIHTAVEEISSLVKTKIFVKQPSLDIIIKEWNPYAAKEYRQLLWTTRKALT